MLVYTELNNLTDPRPRINYEFSTGITQTKIQYVSYEILLFLLIVHLLDSTEFLNKETYSTIY